MTPAAATAPTADERTAAGRARRKEAPRSRHGEWAPEADRPDPVALLEEQGDSRVAELLPIRYGRMAVSPFAYYRGAAYAMAWDLANAPTSGIQVQLCGDAHLSNFGGFASPERKLIFDLNDFDETLPGPFEWDVKRLAASIDVAARARSFSSKDRHRAVRASVEEYRTAMRDFAEMDPLDVWYAHIGADDIRERFGDQVGRSGVKRFDKLVAKGKGKDSSRAFAKLAHAVDGGARILPDPPLIAPIEDLVPRTAAKKFEKAMIGLIESYVETLPLARRRVIERYRYAHCARKLVGVGSVGTRAWVVLMLGPGGDPLFLQAKEAQPSVLAPFAGESEFEHQGERVVEGQRLMQSASDIALGWVTATSIEDGVARDFYVRQLWDWKTSADIDVMVPRGMAAYARMCGWILARAHACSGEPAEIAGYLGSGESFDRAITQFAESYADQNERDHRALVQAIDDGRIDAVWDL
jgi:uncharacterized protein (DUF2252 family)